ncbi:fibrous sheath-interacting protein 2 [Monomorium pharaonis]|uniref:fibrous sheath-interacting protein 2 n=1 Tax=Monomorium pharaonis TaxID=307658 RepID=UPI00063F5751|nr:fibrous sheath-interacting protein 2 [Monomorium pharaonis]XP_036138764.1 fibrous sheath-interacting protein 2 [Monomorium pharaonis]
MMPLEHKIPMIPAPKGAYNFTRRKVGKKLWEPKLEFDLSDPYCHEAKFPYEPLHDKHLLEFFSRQINLKSLLKADLITDDMDVKCSLRDYNTYRKYLRQVHADRIKRELRKRNRLFVERRALHFAEDQARKETERLKEREKLSSERQLLVQQRLLQEDLKIRKLKERAFRTTQRLKLLKLIRQEEQRLINIKHEEKSEQIRQKCKIATKIARHKVIDTLMDWKKKDKARKKGMEKRLIDIEQQKKKNMEERWRKKQQFQEEDIAKQEMLLQCIDARRQRFIEAYNNKINEEATKMKRLLDNAKLFTNCYMKRHLLGGRKVICCKKYFKNNTNKNMKKK